MKIIDNIQIDTQNLVYEENGNEHVVATNEQVNELKESIGRNVDGIARLGTDKQDKLSQTDLDNIAGLNQLQDKLDAKASKTEVNSLSMCMSDTVDIDVFPTKPTSAINEIVAQSNGYISVKITYNRDLRSKAYLSADGYRLTSICPYEALNGEHVYFLPVRKGMSIQFYCPELDQVSSVKSYFYHAKEI